MAREQFFYPETSDLLRILDDAARRAGVSRGKCFEDFLHLATCSLSGGQMEEQYLQVVPQYSEGPRGRRAIDSICELLGRAIAAMEDTRKEVKDVLGDLYAGGITYGEAGQYYTPQATTYVMAELATHDIAQEDEPDRPRSVLDCCCGSGRMLMSVAKHHPHWEFVGQDVDLRCVRLCAINMGLRNMYGYVVWGNSLALEKKLVYRTGFNLSGGVIREIPVEACPAPVQQVVAETQSTVQTQLPETEPVSDSRSRDPAGTADSIDDDSAPPSNQLRLF